MSASQFLPSYDSEAAQIRSHLCADALAAFKRSDGKLSCSNTVRPVNCTSLFEPRSVPWRSSGHNLYSGREQEAWSNLKRTLASQ